MFYKIDPNLLGGVGVLGCDESCEVVVYYSDEAAIKEILEKSDLQVLGRFPFISAVALRIKRHQIFELAQNYYILYLSKPGISQILLNRARQTIKVDELHGRGLCGSGVNIAIIDTGCYPHLDFTLGVNRIVKFVDFINDKKSLYDDNGHGTFVAGVLAGSGLVSNAEYKGVAFGSGLVVLKALKSDGQTEAYKVLEAMQWVYSNHKKYNIRAVCMSFGSTPLAQNDPLTIGANALWQKGVVVVSAVGNDGPASSTVKSPGSSAQIITVGSADTRGADIKVADFSSRGPVFEFIKPDLIAPGVNITATANSTQFYRQMSGTSVSTPFVAGVCAILLQQNPHLSPNDIKAALLSSAARLPFDPNSCGAGLLDAEKCAQMSDLIK